MSKLKKILKEYQKLSLWKGVDFPSHRKDWKKFEPNNKLIALNISYVLYNTEEIRHAYKSK